MERKTVKFEVKSVDETEGVIVGYGSTFNDAPDSYGDVVDDGAFTKTIQENADSIVSLFNHDPNLPVGKPELSQDKHGLLTAIHLVRGVQKAEETLLLAKAGVLKRMSIGYDTIKSEMVNGIRHLKEVKLYDVSPVIFAANPSALILDVKAAEYALAHGNIDSIQESVKSLQALLDKYQGKHEPPKGTHAPEVNQEAANLEQMLDGIQSEITDFDVKQANARIDAALAKL
jgi:hypothetical protein